MVDNPKVVTRFAPSPTGFLHIGGARTALFNWLLARHYGGQFLLRIEDTDRNRSTPEAVEAIIKGLQWLGLDWDGEPISQFSRRERHTEVAYKLLEAGHAYRCYASQEELTAMREQARAEGRQPRYDGQWRDRSAEDAPAGVKPVIRFKAPQNGETTIDDAVQGPVTVGNDQLDDLILLRSDGTPTYMLSVVVDDIDMDVTHVVRGDDHLTNAFRQIQLYHALKIAPPVYAHIPLIHGPDGAKLSKRHGALGVEAYRDLGYLPEAVRNYLLRLGWAHGDDEVISTEQAVEWFTLESIGRSAARFDFQKLEHLNGHYMREADDIRLAEAIRPRVEAKLDTGPIPQDRWHRVVAGMPGLKSRAKTLVELAENSIFYVAERPLSMTDKAKTLLTGDAASLLGDVEQSLAGLDVWDEPNIEGAVREVAERHDLKLGKVAQPLRAAITGSTTSPGIFEVAAVLGRQETLARLNDVVVTRP
ncbi:glutamate--tRNA ligase [Fodinicurvata sp. EGI_FJ10296]|uniref:glutamate--tRNA ligase n=1 Tax=Fodinicurvata sp. EGI_FJ10296 TaxID=3231908 RepID=UPI003455FAAA